MIVTDEYHQLTSQCTYFSVHGGLYNRNNRITGIKWKLVGNSRHDAWSSVLSVCLVAQSCPTLCDPVDCSPPDSSVHGVLQARILEWVAMFSSRDAWSMHPLNVSSIPPQSESVSALLIPTVHSFFFSAMNHLVRVLLRKGIWIFSKICFYFANLSWHFWKKLL